jgi:hypothetical protein
VITLSPEEFRRLTPPAQQEVMALLTGSPPRFKPPEPRADFTGINLEEATDMTPAMIKKFFQVCSDPYKAALKVFAEKGPVIDLSELGHLGINQAQFRSRMTVRTRTVTNDPEAYLFAYDHWERGEDGQYVKGKYAVTPMTYESLRKYFAL